ncbi:amidase [Kushneria sinocarnis]|uniref:Amidase n=1 Tax=Kushneria sinocarnis TaxID=595502 RepID=A0A420WU19_9GAMM|nr:amidase [Kushneria sinocarnis]RKQ96938.1 amidase [Kushneria sinocarnis]
MVLASIGFLHAGPVAAGSGFDPLNATLPELKAALDSGAISSAELVRFYQRRMRAYDDQGPHINAILHQHNRQALERARRLDARRDQQAHGPLYGIPFVVKDNIDVIGHPTTGGSMALKSAMPEDSATLVRRLQNAGAIVLGKANMTEFAASYGQPGYSSLGGVSRNPRNPDYSVLGSSSGPAAAVAANFAAFAVGTDTEGSARGPAHAAGLVAARPTLGRVSRDGVIPLALSFDTPAPLTRSVTGAAWVLEAMSGTDKADDATNVNQQHPPRFTGPREGATPSPQEQLQQARIGVIRQRDHGDPAIEQRFGRALHEMEDAGARLVDVRLGEIYYDLWPSVVAPVHEAEFEPQLERYLRQFGEHQPHDLRQLLARCERINHRRQQQPGSASQEPPISISRIRGMKERLEESMAGSPRYLDVLTHRLPKLRDRLRGFMQENRLDALIFPTEACAAPPREGVSVQGYDCDSQHPFALGYIATATGFPEITLPMGTLDSRIPVGVSLLGRDFDERQLFELAGALEQLLPNLPVAAATPALPRDP